MKIADMSVELIDHMGDDLSVVNAARVSFAKESQWERDVVYDLDDPLQKAISWTDKLNTKDTKLINYLARHNHWTPFAHCFLSFRVKVPMFVAMQLDKHTVGLVTNSVSRRYVDDEPEFWLPVEWRGRPENMKQGSSGVVTNNVSIIKFVEAETRRMLINYEELIAVNVAPEQARMVLPMNTMTERIWSGSLAAFARVCKLRLDSHAQQEIQEVAQKVAALVEPLFPASFKALLDH